MRVARNISQQLIAEKLGVTKQYIGQIEKNIVSPPSKERCDEIILALSLPETEKKQLLQLAAEKSINTLRSFGLNEPEETYASSLVKVPLLGSAPAGNKTYVGDQVEDWIDLPTEMVRGRRIYLLRAMGDSMIEAGIRDRDIVIVNASDEPQKGDIVVAMIDGETTIKKFFRYDGVIILEPANPNYEKMTFTANNRVQIKGIVLGVLWKGFL